MSTEEQIQTTHLALKTKQSELMRGSATLGYVAIINLKREIDSLQAEYKRLVRKLEREEDKRDVK